MITSTGIHIQKAGGVEGTPSSVDIAVHAGRICRFGGSVWYPLLPHLVFVGLMAYRRSGSVADLLWGFLHDAHEVATSDVPRPFKCDCMRHEQREIDIRIKRQYFSVPYPPVDEDLIKQCDIDAVHIEAVALGVPGFAETELKYAGDYTGRKEIYAGQEDVDLFYRIMNASPFGSPDTINGTASSGVTSFAAALEQAEGGQYGGFLNVVKGWGLL